MARRRTVAATAEAIWDLLADFGAISSWVDNVDHSCVLVQAPQPIGTTRRVQIGRTTVVERITTYEQGRALGYAIEGLPRLLGTVGNRWSLHPSPGGRTDVTLTSTVEIGSNPLAAIGERLAVPLVAAPSAAMLDDLATRLEVSHV